MKLTKYGHACLLVEEVGARLLLDPGSFSEGFEGLTELDAILITHNHPDHLAAAAISALLKANPGAKVYADPDSIKPLHEASITAAAVAPGAKLNIAGVAVEVFGGAHAPIHRDMPGLTNAAYMIAGRLLHPGDSHTVPGVPVEILALPTVAPWSKVEETIDYLRAVNPKVFVPIHDAITTAPDMYAQMIAGFNTHLEARLVELTDGQPVEL